MIISDTDLQFFTCGAEVGSGEMVIPDRKRGKGELVPPKSLSFRQEWLVSLGQLQEGKF